MTTPTRAVRCGTVAEVAAYINRPEDTLRDWRIRGLGPKSYRMGARVVYDWVDVDAWLDEQKAASA